MFGVVGVKLSENGMDTLARTERDVYLIHILREWK